MLGVVSFVRGWHACVSLVILMTTASCCHGFNVDIDSAVVHHGAKNTKFGYRAEFLKQSTTGSTRLLVSAPRFTPGNRSSSGKYFLCEPLKQTCNDEKALPLITRRDSTEKEFGEKEEMFGLTVSRVNSSTTLVCGPLWKDLPPNRGTHFFPVGRCQLIPPGTSNVSPLTKDRSKYIAKIDVDSFSIWGFLTGAAQFGFSAAADGNGQAVIGVPGFSGGRGSFGVLDLSNEDFDMMEKDFFDIDVDVHLGFSVVTGNFCGNATVCFAVSNRMPIGKVYIVAREQPTIFRQTQMLQDLQDYSSFGFSLCAMDINGDGLSDLLVGAPTFSSHAKQPPSYDEGSVFVYLQVQGKLIQKIRWAGGRKSFARFGSAIGDIGDLNRDSTHDVAVGAPQEDEGRGAVYIYLGSSKGPDTVYSQRISGLEVDNGLFSFGSHISQPTSDLIPYNYPAFAVGSPESDAVVVLRTRLIINARVNIITPLSPINSSNSDCPPNISTGSVKASGCIQLEVCLNYSAKNGVNQFINLSFDLSLKTDTLVDVESSRRLRLYRIHTNTTSTSVVDTLSVNSKQGHCERYIGVLAEEKIFRNPLLPVKLDATFALNVTSLESAVKPILNTSLPDSAFRELRFRIKCGEDQTCKPDLALKGSVLYLPSEDDLNLNMNIANKTSEVILELTVWNKQETAFGISLAVAIKGQIRFLTATGGDGGFHFGCKENTTSDDSGLGQATSSLTCVTFPPLEHGEEVSLNLLFEAASVPLETTSPLVVFNVTAMPYSISLNEEANTSDNAVTLESRKAIVADVQIIGSSDPRTLNGYDSDHTGLLVIHKLLVTNNGPSFLPATNVHISLPYMDSDGKELVASHAVTIKQLDGTEEQCPPDSLLPTDADRTIGKTDADRTILKADADRTSQSTPSLSDDRLTTSQSVTVSGHPTTTSQGTQSEIFGEVEPSRRRRRQSENNNDVETREISAQTRKHDGSVDMDCRKYRCKTFQCSLRTLQRHEQAEINVSLVLSSAHLPFSRKVDRVWYTTTSKVEEPPSPFFYSWTESRSEHVSTLIRKVTSASHKQINIWIVIGGILGGLLLLSIITVSLERVGFFRRADKAKLERLKRQSGYYDKRRQARSSPPLGLTEETKLAEANKD